MLSVSIWNEGDGEHLGSWYSDEQVQVPRKGDILWLQTDKVRHSRWKVINVQWSFRDSALGISRERSMQAEVWIKPAPQWRLLERFVRLFPEST